MRKPLNVVTAGNTTSPKKIIVLLHGHRSNSKQVKRLARLLHGQVPDALILMPEAPEKINHSAKKLKSMTPTYSGDDFSNSRRWFGLTPKGVAGFSLRLTFNSIPVVDDINLVIDQALAQHKLQDKDLAIFGLSQGGIMALYTALRRPNPCAGVVCHSGLFFGLTPARSTPDVLMVAGADDELTMKKRWPVTFILSQKNAIERLKARGVPVTEHLCPNLGHGTNRESIKKSVNYIVNALK